MVGSSQSKQSEDSPSREKLQQDKGDEVPKSQKTASAGNEFSVMVSLSKATHAETLAEDVRA